MTCMFTLLLTVSTPCLITVISVSSSVLFSRVYGKYGYDYDKYDGYVGYDYEGYVYGVYAYGAVYSDVVSDGGKSVAEAWALGRDSAGPECVLCDDVECV